VTQSNVPPIALDDSRTVSCGTDPIIIKVLENDNDLDGDDSKLRVTNLLSQPAYGIDKINTDRKTVTYTPNGTGCGEKDTFEYEITDDSGDKAQAKVFINMGENTTSPDENKPPVANNDKASTACRAVAIDVLGNDTDPDDDALSITKVSGMTLGKAYIEDNLVFYIPTDKCGEVKAGTDTFNYEISDGNGHTDKANITVDITGKCNSGCTEANPDYAFTPKVKSVIINVLDNDDGALNGLRVTKIDQPWHGKAAIVGNAIKYTPNPDFTGVEKFWYEITEREGYTYSAEITVTVK
jgi:hypothetical protein